METNFKIRIIDSDRGKFYRILLLLITVCLLTLWIPAFIDKIMNFTEFKNAMMRQPLPIWFSKVLVFAIPALEGIVTLLLIPKRTRKLSFFLSFALMLLFTSYIGLALLGAWKHFPCGCGLVIRGMTWRAHFWFNTIFLVLSGYGICLFRSLDHIARPAV